MTLVEERRAALEELCRAYRVRRLSLFGSAARGDFDPERSDLDFVVEFDPPEGGRYADQYFGFQRRLEGLFGTPVDLVEADAIRNPFFRQSVDSQKALLFAS